jgi:hypothetical protein
MPREPPVTGVTLPASLLMMFVLIYLPDHLPSPFESAQYFVPCAVMLLRHSGLTPNSRKALYTFCASRRLLLQPACFSLSFEHTKITLDDSRYSEL